ncbi:MAG: helix-hairpin-helix domain-containing protein [Caldilineaceae bacterium]|nr:helix-hairpin-helix domain-containing protein [Caldilineaceae bacterium]
MKSLRRGGCWTAFILIVAFGIFIFLFSQPRQVRSEIRVKPVQGNVAMFGGDVRISEDEQIAGNLLLVGDDLTLEGRIGGNLVVVGGDVELTGHAQVGGNISVVGGDAEIEGSSVIGGNVAIVGGDVELAGHSRVGGNVRVVGGRIEQGPEARVAGGTSWRVYANGAAHTNLQSAAPAPLALIDPPKPPDPPSRLAADSGGAREQARGRSERHQRAVEEAEEAAEELAEAAEELAGKAEDAAEAAIERAELQREAALEAAAAARAHAAATRTPWFLVFLGKLLQAFLWTLLITGLVLLFAWLLPKQVRAISETAEQETALSFATGAIGILGSAVLAAILTITICFALLALPLLALVALVLVCGWTVTCYWLGRRLDELIAGPGDLSWSPLVSVGLSSLVITGVTAFAWVIFPCLGFIIALLIGSTGTGAVVVHVARRSGRLPGGVLGDRLGGPAPSGEAASPEGGDEGDARADISEADLPDMTESPAGAFEAPSGEVPERSEEESTPGTDKQEYTDSLAGASAAEDEANDFTRIAGIGPTYAARLREAGVETFSQLAALDVEEIAAVIGCPALRVERERLREQARELAGQE